MENAQKTESKPHRGPLILGSLIAFYLLIVSTQSFLKLLWPNELITYYIARQPGLHALRAGADPSPPLMHPLIKA